MNRLIVAGRVMTGLFFVLAGVSKLTDYGGTLGFMAEAGVEPSGLLLPLVVMLEIGGGAILALGRWPRLVFLTALALAAFTLATNIGFHRFWEYEGVMHRLEISLFFKNLVVMAALFLIAGQTAERA